MSTVRLQIISAVAAALETATGLTVYRNLDYALESENMPAIALQSGPDRSETGINGVMNFDADIEIHILVANSSDPESEADQIEAQAHRALFADFRFGGLARNLERVSADWNFDLGDCCQRSLVYRVQFAARYNDLETQG